MTRRPRLSGSQAAQRCERGVHARRCDPRGTCARARGAAPAFASMSAAAAMQRHHKTAITRASGPAPRGTARNERATCCLPAGGGQVPGGGRPQDPGRLHNHAPGQLRQRHQGAQAEAGAGARARVPCFGAAGRAGAGPKAPGASRQGGRGASCWRVGARPAGWIDPPPPNQKQVGLRPLDAKPHSHHCACNHLGNSRPRSSTPRWTPRCRPRCTWTPWTQRPTSPWRLTS